MRCWRMSVVWKRNSKVQGWEHKNKDKRAVVRVFLNSESLWRFFPIARRKGSFLLYAMFEKYPFCANSFEQWGDKQFI